jgi:hypothetical protein
MKRAMTVPPKMTTTDVRDGSDIRLSGSEGNGIDIVLGIADAGTP